MAVELPPQQAKAPAEPAEKPIREQSIYIPYAKLREVFEKHGRGVFLPYEKFQELWQAAQEKTAPAVEPKPPVGALITEIDNEAAVSKDVVRVTARVKIEVLAEGWNEVPLRLAEAAITSATIAGQPARIIGGPGQDYRLLVEKKGKQPEQIELLLEYAKAISRMPGQNSVSFQAPQAPVSRWRIVIPQAGVKVNIHPLLAATELPEEKKALGPPEKKPADETVVLAFVGAAPLVRIDWTPKAEGATGLAALASVLSEQQVWLSEAVARTRATLNYTISRAELTRLVVEVPGDQKVVNVFDANVRQWAVEQVETRQRITAQLFEPAKGSQQVTVELEKYAGERPQETLVVPVVKAIDVGRQQGVVVVAVAQGLRAEAAKAEGLLQVDAAELPGPLAKGTWAFAYRYASVPFDLTLDVEKLKPRIQVDSLVEAYLEPQRLTLDLAAVYNIEQSGEFRLEFDVPADFEVRKVEGREIAGAAKAQVDTHHREGEKNTRLVVNLARKAKDRVALVIELQKDLHEPNLLAPTGNAADIPVPVPIVAPKTVERAVGRLIVYAPESLLVKATASDGLRGISPKEALEGMQTLREAKPGEVRPVLPFAFTQEPITLRLAAERRRPKVSIQQLLVARIDSGVVKYQAAFSYEVLYSGVKALRIDVPAEIAAKVNVETTGIQKQEIAPAPDDLAPNYVAWALSGTSELLGKGKIDLAWETKIKKLEVGGSVLIDVPCLKPMSQPPVEIDLATGQIVLVKAESLDIQEEKVESLRGIDPQTDLVTPVPEAARAFEFHEPWVLQVRATQHALHEVKRTSIERAVVRMVVTAAGDVSVQALYRMRSAQQRLAVNLPADAQFDARPARISGQPIDPEGSGGQFFIPLTGVNPDQPFLLELRYTVPFDGSQLDLPVFPEDPAALKVYLGAYLPADRQLLGIGGAWNEEFRWWLDPSLQWRPVPLRIGQVRLDDNYLVSWVREGIDLKGEATDSFETDGTLYLYSTFRPAAPPEGSLYLRTIKQEWLHALVFLVVVLGGIGLLPVRLPGRVAAIGGLIVVLVLGGAFLPTFSRQRLDVVLASAIFIVLVLWVVWYFVWTRPRSLAQRQTTAAASPVQTAPAAGPGEGGQSHA